MQKLSFVLFTVAVMVMLIKLGLWQLSRAEEKTELSNLLMQRSEMEYLRIDHLPSDPRWYRLTLRGQFDVSRAILLDNQVRKGKVGYQLYVPFTSQQREFLVNLGWLAAPIYRDQLPTLPSLSGTLSISGVIALPSRLPSLQESHLRDMSPLRVQGIDINELSLHFQRSFLPWVLQLDGTHALALPSLWKPVVMGAEKHYGYAFQWFLLAFSVSILGMWWWYREER
jgi:cytochrome oxidase assembly protein ShyY1